MRRIFPMAALVDAEGAREVDADEIENVARTVVERRASQHEGGAR